MPTVPACKNLPGYGPMPLDVGEVIQASDLDLSSVGAAWGAITGTLASQTDLNTALGGKETSGAAATAQAFSIQRANHTGTQAWATLTGTPTTVAGYGITDAAPAPIATLVVPTTGQTQTFTTGKADHIIALNHVATIAAQTLVFPVDANSRIGQTLRVFCRSIVTTLTLTLNSNTVLGLTLTTLPVNGNAAWQKVAASTWARIQ